MTWLRFPEALMEMEELTMAYIVLAILATVIIGQWVVIIIQQIKHSKERKDLYNRIMARDLTEYSHAVQHENQQSKPLSGMQKKFKEYEKTWKTGR